MSTTRPTVSVRMYNMGFGDAFLVTVRDRTRRWRMLVDCGAHPQGQARPLRTSVAAIIDDLADQGHPPYVDVVVATHHHADHIGGFALDQWSTVTVGEVWVPFVEDPDDADARALRTAHTVAARRLLGLVEQRVKALNSSRHLSAVLSAARWFAVNSVGNKAAMDRLLGRDGRGFANQPAIRYLPVVDSDNAIPTSLPDTVMHVLGPPRDPTFLKRMNPPRRAGWFALDEDCEPEAPATKPLFSESFVMTETQLAQHAGLRHAVKLLGKLDGANDTQLLAAASILERSVNNTSLFLLLDVAGRHLLFPGDAQQGAWEHVLADPKARDLVTDLALYKVSHHGSGNGTPKHFVEQVLHDGAHAMLPWGLVNRWKATIPDCHLLQALADHNHKIIRADQPIAEPGRVTVHKDLWTEITWPGQDTPTPVH